MKNIILALLAGCTLACTSGGTPGSGNVNSNPQESAQNKPSRTPGSIETPPLSNVNKDREGTDVADFEGTAGITDKKNPNVKSTAIMSDVRSARHENYDRVVFEFLGDDMPTYHIEYIDKPVRSCGSGEVVPLAGDGWLEIRFTDAQAHAPEGDATITDRSRSPNLPIVRDLKITCDFEGEVTWVAGVASPNRYRALELKNPTRLAIDIKH